MMVVVYPKLQGEIENGAISLIKVADTTDDGIHKIVGPFRRSSTH
jgi:hypothetical protein